MCNTERYNAIVTCVESESFKARILEFEEDDEIEIRIDEVDEDERYLIKPGASFVWLVTTCAS